MSTEASRIKLQGFLEDKLKWHDHTHLVVADPDMPQEQWFIHTIGRARANLPELILTGPLDHQLAMDLFADVIAIEQRHGALTPGPLPLEQTRQPLALVDVSNEFVLQKRVAQASSRFGGNIRVMQVLYADPAGVFPTDPNYNQLAAPQQTLWNP